MSKRVLHDLITKAWTRIKGKKTPREEVAWLSGPMGCFFERPDAYIYQMAVEQDLEVRLNEPNTGIFERFRDLDSDSFCVEKVDPRIIDFYENTSSYTIATHSTTKGIWRPFSWLISAVQSQRLPSINTKDADWQHNEVYSLHDTNGDIVHTVWQRKNKHDVIQFSGIFSICKPTAVDYPCLRCFFPIPSGNLNVILKPSVKEDGSLVYSTFGNTPGGPGFYFTTARNNDHVNLLYQNSINEQLTLTPQNDHIEGTQIVHIWGSHYMTNKHIITKND